MPKFSCLVEAVDALDDNRDDITVAEVQRLAYELDDAHNALLQRPVDQAPPAGPRVCVSPRTLALMVGGIGGGLFVGSLLALGGAAVVVAAVMT